MLTRSANRGILGPWREAEGCSAGRPPWAAFEDNCHNALVGYAALVNDGPADMFANGNVGRLLAPLFRRGDGILHAHGHGRDREARQLKQAEKDCAFHLVLSPTLTLQSHRPAPTQALMVPVSLGSQWRTRPKNHEGHSVARCRKRHGAVFLRDRHAPA